MKLIIKKNIEELNRSFAIWLVSYIVQRLQEKDFFSFCLSGGNTPKKLYQLLASGEFRNKIEWQKIHFFWGDERVVPFTDEKNNARMAFEALLNHVPVKKGNIHIIDTAVPPEVSALAYRNILKKYFGHGSQTFDLVLLGLGDNAHTLSLFPGYDSVHEKKDWVNSFYLADQKMYRITLTAPSVNMASAIAFLVSGSDKADAVKHVIEDPFNPSLYPAQVINPQKGELYWWLDESAAGKLTAANKNESTI